MIYTGMLRCSDRDGDREKRKRRSDCMKILNGVGTTHV